MKLVLTLICSLGLISNSFGQSDSLPISTWNSFLHNNTNIGLTASASHLGPSYVHPSISAKFFGLNVRFSPPTGTTSNINNFYQWRTDLDLIPVKKNNNNIHYLSVGTGYMSYTPKDQPYDLDHVFGVVGLTRYSLNTRHKFAFHAGVVNRYRWNWDGPVTVTHDVILPYAEFTYTLYALKFKNPFIYHLSNNINDYEPSFYYTFATLGHFFNPSVSVGVGGVHAFGYSPAIRFNLGPVYAGFGGLSAPNKDQNTIQLGINTLDVNLIPNYKSFITCSWIGTYTYEYEAVLGNTSYEQTANFNSFLVGLNNYKIDSRFSFSAMVGAMFRDYDLAFTNEPDRNHLYGQLSYHIHAFKYRPVGYVARSKQVKKTRFKSDKPDKLPITFSQALRNNINPRVSLGAGMTHAAFFMPTIGAKIWRADIGVSVVGIGGEPWFAINGDLDAIPLTHDANNWVTIGASGMGSFDSFIGFHAGYKRYKNRTATSLKLGVAIFSQFGSGESIIPSIDLSYHIHLFKMKFRPLKNVPKNPFNNDDQTNIR